MLNDKFPRAHDMLVLAGRLCGKALLEGHHLEHLRLNPILLKHVVAEPLSLKDLALLDEDLARGLDALLHMDPSDVPSLCLTWSVSDDLDVDDKKWTRDLVPNGSEKNVTGQDARGFVAARFLNDRTVNGLTALHITVYDALTESDKNDFEILRYNMRTLVLGGADLLAKTTAAATDEDVVGTDYFPITAGLTPMDVARTCGFPSRRDAVVATLTAAIAQRAL